MVAQTDRDTAEMSGKVRAMTQSDETVPVHGSELRVSTGDKMGRGPGKWDVLCQDSHHSVAFPVSTWVLPGCLGQVWQPFRMMKRQDNAQSLQGPSCHPVIQPAPFTNTKVNPSVATRGHRSSDGGPHLPGSSQMGSSPTLLVTLVL